MFRQILRVQWRMSKFALLLLLPLCVALPVVFTRFARRFATGAIEPQALSMLRIVESTAISYPMLAVIAGCALALTAWAWDHRTNHVYALTLPVERWRYALMKMGTGVLMLAILAASLLAGAILAIATTEIPPGLHTYPISLATRFFFAAFICYAVTFAFAAGTMRTTVRVFGLLFLVFVVGSLVAEMMNDALRTDIPLPIGLLAEALATWPGPFSVFGGNWMLIDV